jgi:hypothetical protein
MSDTNSLPTPQEIAATLGVTDPKKIAYLSAVLKMERCFGHVVGLADAKDVLEKLGAAL